MNSVFDIKNEINIKAITKKCSKYDVISFDVFDTLLKRNVSSPDDIFSILESYASEYLGISGFAKIRLDKARVLFRNNPYATLEEIYSLISCELNIDLNPIKEKEIELEISLVTANYYLKEVYDYCKSKNKKIVAISDMYLSKNTISKMLAKCGYDIEDVFVSCEEKGGKGDSSLFEIVANKLELNKSEWLHIGDSLRGDYIGARRSGISSYHIPQRLSAFNTNRFKDRITEQKQYSVVESLINNKLPGIDSYYERFGYAILGPLVHSYVAWLMMQLKKENINHVFFLSRDGYLIKKTFDYCNKSDIQTHYLYVSRRSIRIPYAWTHHSFEEVMDFLPPTRCYSIRMFLEILGLNPDKYADLCAKKGFHDLDKDILLSEIKSSNKVRELYKAVEKDFLENARKEYLVFEKYLHQQDFKGKVAIVDIGWNLSMQYFLENMPYYADNNLQIYGYYLGVVPTARKVSYAKGFISDSDNGTYVESVSSFIGLMESVFLAREGSTLRYIDTDNFIKPELLDYEYTISDLEYKAFQDIQSGAFEYFTDADEISKVADISLNGFNAFLPFKTFGTDPYLKDVKMFSKFRYLSEGITFFANTKPIIYYLTNFRAFKADILKARWKIGFMKKVMLMRLPYINIYKFITKH